MNLTQNQQRTSTTCCASTLSKVALSVPFGFRTLTYDNGARAHKTNLLLERDPLFCFFIPLTRLEHPVPHTRLLSRTVPPVSLCPVHL